MIEKLSIQDIKIDLIFQEASDKLHAIDSQLAKAQTQPKPILAPPGAPRPDFIQNAHRQYSLQAQKQKIHTETKEKFDKEVETASPAKQEQYNSKYQDWQKNPRNYEAATKEKDGQEKNLEGMSEKDQEISKQNDLKTDFATNGKMVEKQDGPFTNSYTDRFSGSSGGPGGPNSEPGKQQDKIDLDIDKD